MARSILPNRIQEHLNTHKWVVYSKTTPVEVYKKDKTLIYIQPSKIDRNFFAWVIEYEDKRSETGAGVTESLLDTLKIV
jgi:flavin-dependent dehydrogenase